MVAGLMSCAKENLNSEKDTTQNEGVPMTFNVNVLETKAAKDDWADGDIIYVFFKGLATKYLILTYDGTEWDNTSGGGTLLDTDFEGLGTKTLTAVHFPVAVNVTYADNKFSFTSGGKPVYNYYLFETGKAYTVSGTTVTATLSMGKPANMVQFHVAGIQANVSDYTFGCSKIKPVACKSVGTDGTITEDELNAGEHVRGFADSDGGIFAGRLTTTESTDYSFYLGGNDYLYTLTRNRSLIAGKMYNFPAPSVTGSTNWNITAVDLGITVGGKKIYWAKCNVGAATDTENGDYYAWGEIEPYYNVPMGNPLTWKAGKTKGYDWNSYKWYHNVNPKGLTKYCDVNTSGYPSNFTDELTTLVPEDDVAYATLGGKFRMPTSAEMEALVATKSNTTDYTWAYCDGTSGKKYNDTNVHGWKIVKKSSSATLFLIFAGYLNGTKDYFDSGGNYWSSSLYTNDNSYKAHRLTLTSDMVDDPVKITPVNRNMGYSVRPVYVIPE